MNNIVVFLFLAFAPIAYSQSVSLDSVGNYIGKTVTICELVQSTFQTKSESKVSYINFGKPYPNHSFTVVIFKKDLENFDYDPVVFLKKKTICVTGEVSVYKDKPQIVVNSPKQIVVKE
ncbi:MAG: DNA-binding protein [Flavobacterium sp.]|nr:DNA-binding protein [Flavobacterium sp.]